MGCPCAPVEGLFPVVWLARRRCTLCALSRLGGLRSSRRGGSAAGAIARPLPPLRLRSASLQGWATYYWAFLGRVPFLSGSFACLGFALRAVFVRLRRVKSIIKRKNFAFPCFFIGRFSFKMQSYHGVTE